MIPPTSPMVTFFLSLSHCQTRYPPPISAIAATKNNPKDEIIKSRPELAGSVDSNLFVLFTWIIKNNDNSYSSNNSSNYIIKVWNYTFKGIPPA